MYNYLRHHMIALLRGTLIEKHPNQAILETGEPGAESATTSLPHLDFFEAAGSGQQVVLRIHTHVREERCALYGFLTQDEQRPVRKTYWSKQYRSRTGD